MKPSFHPAIMMLACCAASLSAKDSASRKSAITTEAELRGKYCIHDITHDDSGSITGIWGKIALSNPTGDPETDAVALLNELAPLYGFKNVRDDYRLDRKSNSSVVFQRYYHDVPFHFGQSSLTSSRRIR